jgi:cytochrome c biogenesis protein CcmG/thiol:disulfide interchange protein DsbE
MQPSSDSTGPRKWRVVAILVPAVAFVGLLAYATMQERGAPDPGDRAPGFEGPLLGEEGSLALSDLEGRPVLLNFWWSGCEPCKDEAPALRRAERAYGDEVAFVGINIRDAESDALEFAHNERLTYPHVRDEALQIYDDYGLTGQPESFFIDSDGVVVQHVAGPMFESDLTSLLNVLVARDA